MRALVCGGRGFSDMKAVSEILDRVTAHSIRNIIIHGGAKGADSLAEAWAKEEGIHTAVVTARWGTYGKKAGYLRNSAMSLLLPDLVIAFPGGRGTEMMKEIAWHDGIRVVEVLYDEQKKPVCKNYGGPRGGVPARGSDNN